MLKQNRCDCSYMERRFQLLGKRLDRDISNTKVKRLTNQQTGIFGRENNSDSDAKKDGKIKSCSLNAFTHVLLVTQITIIHHERRRTTLYSTKLCLIQM